MLFTSPKFILHVHMYNHSDRGKTTIIYLKVYKIGTRS